MSHTVWPMVKYKLSSIRFFPLMYRVFVTVNVFIESWKAMWFDPNDLTKTVNRNTFSPRFFLSFFHSFSNRVTRKKIRLRKKHVFPNQLHNSDIFGHFLPFWSVIGEGISFLKVKEQKTNEYGRKTEMATSS